mmetsp:Transcript_8998/g.33555  ORF Transcript_8998/g.33555 Transcript_8998/m.33555 type:complete len:214 (+) Transcript_8998:141-782(+)
MLHQGTYWSGRWRTAYPNSANGLRRQTTDGFTQNSFCHKYHIVSSSSSPLLPHPSRPRAGSFLQLGYSGHRAGLQKLVDFFPQPFPDALHLGLAFLRISLGARLAARDDAVERANFHRGCFVRPDLERIAVALRFQAHQLIEARAQPVVFRHQTRRAPRRFFGREGRVNFAQRVERREPVPPELAFRHHQRRPDLRVRVLHGQLVPQRRCDFL